MKDLIFQIIDWESFDDENDHEFYIRLFGRRKDGKSVRLTVGGFKPYFYVKPNHEYDLSDGGDEFIKDIQEKLYYGQKKSLEDKEVVIKKEFKTFNNYKDLEFLKLTLKNQKSIYSYKNAIQPTITKIFKNKEGEDEERKVFDKSREKGQIYESNLPPMLKFMHDKDIKSCGWIKVKKDYLVKDNNSNCDIGRITDWENIKTYESDEMAPFRILSFDIECERRKGDGRLPDVEDPDDRIIQIGMVYNHIGKSNCYKKSIITIGDTDPIEGVEVINCKDEEKLLVEFKKQMIKEDPDIITGHNILGFDYRYIYNRAKLLGINDKVCKMSRNKNEKSEYVEKKLSSSALGDNILKFYSMPGRVNIDVMKFVMTAHKLGSYSLDSLSSTFIRDKIKDIEIREDGKSVIKTSSTYGIKVGQYIRFNYVFLSLEQKYLDGKKFKILELTDDSILIDGKIDKEFLMKYEKKFWCQSKNDIDHKLVTKYQHGSNKDRSLIAEYCIQDCELVTKLLEKLKVGVNNIGMANVTNVPLSYLFLRGQGIKVFSLLSKECSRHNHLIPLIEDQGESWYEGATVFDPDPPGAHFDVIPVLDYASLYPSIMIQRNISHETLVENPAYENLDGYMYHEVTINLEDGSKKPLKFAQKKNGEHGIIPTILKYLLDARKECKKKCKETNDPFLKIVYDGLQLAYKQSANSIYGYTGSPTSAVFKIEVSAATTASGREMLEYARYFSEVTMNFIIRKAREYKLEKFKKICNKKILKYYPHKIECKNGTIINVNSIGNQKIPESKISNKEKKINNRAEFLQYVYDTINQKLYNIGSKIKCIYGDTDSVFIKPKMLKKIKDREQVLIGIILGTLCADIINILLPEKMVLEYEKAFLPLLLITKKRYVGNLFEFDPDSFVQKSMGISLKRRDNANIVKYICGNILEQIINKRDTKGAEKVAKKILKDIIKGKFGNDYFVISRTLKETYADRTMHSHVWLADKIAERDAGNAPQINDRIPWIFVYPEINNKSWVFQKKSKEERKLKDFAEDPQYIKEKGLKPNYLIYIRDQIKNPALEFLNLVSDKGNKIFEEIINTEINYLMRIAPIDRFFPPECEENNIENSNDENLFGNLNFDNDDELINRKNKKSKTKSKKRDIEEINDDDFNFNI